MGARTGRDGIGGASVLASAELSEEDSSKRPERADRRPVRGEEAARVLPRAARARHARRAPGPRRGRALLELVGDGLEGRRGPRHRRVQGPAARGRHGAVRDHDLRVPGADALRGRAGAAAGAARDLRALGGARHRHRRGHRHGRLRVFDGDELVGDMPVAALVDDCPLYDLEPERARRSRIYPDPPARLDAGRRCRATRCSPCSARRTWHPSASPSSSTTRSSARAPCGGRRPRTRPCSSWRTDGGSGAIAVSIDGNGRRVACDPYTGAVEAVLECARNLACVGAEPLGLTNCLNFGNPEKPHIAWQLSRAVEGLRDACLALGVPVVGGNVSLYNEGAEGPIYPTPIVGMVGSLPDAGERCRSPASPRRATRSRSSGRSRPRSRARSSRSCEGRLADGLPRGGPGGAGRRPRGAARGRARGRAPDRARPLRGRARRARSPSAASRAGWARAWTCAAIVEAAGDARTALFGEGPGGARGGRPGRGGRRASRARCVLGTVGGDRLQIEGLADARGGHAPRALRGGDPRCLRLTGTAVAGPSRW